MVDVESEFCGYNKGTPKYFEMWRWNKDMNVAVFGKTELFRIWKQSQNEEDRKKYKAKNDAKRVVYMAMNQKS